MIWATVSSQSCFCWLYRASPSLAAKSIISLISALTIWWCPCVESSLVLLEEGVTMTSAFSWQNSVSFALLHSVLRGQTCLLFQVSLDFLLLHSSPLGWRGPLFPVFVLEYLVGLHITFQVQFFSALLIRAQTSITVASNELPSRHQRSLEMNRDHSVVFEVAPTCCIFDSCWLWALLHFFWGILSRSSRCNGHQS